MALTQEQVRELKRQLREQIQHLPQDKRAEAERQIEEMSAESLEIMIRQQQARFSSGEDTIRRDDIFRMIVEGIIPSKKVAEDKYSIAVLDIKPVSRGHVIIIPKNKIEDAKLLPSGVFKLAKQIAKRFEKIGAKGSEIQTEKKFGEVVVDVIPIYEKKVSVDSLRYEAGEKELEEVFNLLKIDDKKKINIQKNRKEKTAENSGKIIQLKRRIP